MYLAGCAESQIPLSHVTSHTLALHPFSIMPSGAAIDLSFLELLQGLNEKVTSECARVREIRLPHGVASVTALRCEVSALRPIHLSQMLWLDLTVNPSDRISRSQSSRNLGAYSLAEEPVATSQPVTSRDPLSYHLVHP